MKVISLVPSVTEALFDLGLSEKEIIGRTKFCIHPKERVAAVPRIGGTKNIDIEKIRGLKPDLIIASKEENVKEQIEALMPEFRVLLTDVATVEDNYYLLKTLGNFFGKEAEAQQYNLKIYEVLSHSYLSRKVKAAYLIWQNPWMSVGSDTFIHHIMSAIGLENILSHCKRYPEISEEQMAGAEVILLSTEPFPFQQKHLDELKKRFPDKTILLVDGEAFSWFGTHLAKCEAYFRSLLAQVPQG